MIVNVATFLTTGMLRGVEPGCSRESILSTFGEPDIHTPQRKSYPEMLAYECVEFRLRNNLLCAIAVDLEHETSGESAVVEDLNTLDRDCVENTLRRAHVGWRIHELMSDEDTQVLITENSLHLAFRQNRLTRLVADYSGTRY